MKLDPVKSSGIAAIGYENGTLAVQFSSGRTYIYADVPAELVEKMRGAESIGRFFMAEIRSKFKGALQEDEKPE